MTGSSSSPSRSKSRIRQSGLAVKAGRRCAAPPVSGTRGIRSAATAKHLLDTLPRYRAGIARLRQLTAEAGREPASVALTYRVKRYGEAVPVKASDGDRRLFSGSTTDIIADFQALRDLGVGAIDIDFERSDLEDSVAEMRRFKEQVITRL